VRPDPDIYLRPTFFIESEHSDVVAFARDHAAGAATPRERAVRLFNAVRDGIRYDPYTATMEPEVFKASVTLRRGSTFCVPKAILLAAAARAEGIPSRLRFADVRNHLSTERLRRAMRTDVFAFHGLTELWLDGRWVKATPTFNLSLCERFGVRPLEFDGEHDATLHPFDRDGRRHMEYLRDRGSYADLPLDEMLRGLREVYPHLFDARGRWVSLAGGAEAFEAEAAEED
jgi:transglutaminase-like putative cysteine protease